jgi:citrate lyase beta subunit
VQKKGIKVKPEVMIPLVGFKKELDLQVAIVHRVAAEVQKEKKVKLSYQVGTMIEVPRGALTADEIAQTAECRRHGAAILRRSYGSTLQLWHERSHADRARHLPPAFESKMGRLSRCASVCATTWATS